MIDRIVPVKPAEIFANPAPLGLLGLAIACFAVCPLYLGLRPDVSTLQAMALCALLFGAGCQLLTGMMEYANKNAPAGVLFTLFAFSWLKVAADLFLATRGVVASPAVDAILDGSLLVIVAALTYAFGYFSLTLFLFLLDVDLIYVAKLAAFFTHSTALAAPTGWLLVVLGLLSLWLALAALVNPVAGRQVFKETGPIFRAGGRERPDLQRMAG
ncbi:MAG: GPR1/FUN34/YaaH family transporter [Cyanobacteria bacterium REEB65]|nr:GPR1/FUN34/YaaH family transporter [Cyanobacteria bacterium REEB65]